MLRPLAERPKIGAALILLATALAITSHSFNLGVTGMWKWPAAGLIAAAGAAGAFGTMSEGASGRRAFFWPLTISLAAAAGAFGLKQLLLDTARIDQNPEVGAVYTSAMNDVPLLAWSILIGVLWVWSLSDSTSKDDATAPWFGFWEGRPERIWATLTAMTLGAALIRFWKVGHLGLWSDEGIVFIAANNILKTGVPYLETGLLYLRDLPHLYATAASLYLFKDVEFALRLPSVLAGIALVPITYLLALRLFNQKSVALLAAGLVAFHPWIFEYSRFARSYMLMLLWLYLAALFFQTAKISVWAKIGLFVTGFLAATTHQVGQIVLVFAFVALLDKEWREKPLSFWPFLGALLGIVAFKVIFSYGYYFYQDATVEMTVGEAVARRVPFGLPRFDNILVFMRVVPFFLLISAVAALAKDRWLGYKNRSLLYYNAWFFIVMASLILSKKYISLNRGILFFFPLLALGTAFGLLWAARLVRSRPVRIGIGASLAVLLLAYGAYDLRVATIRNYGSLINPNLAPFDGFTFYQDNKSPIKYVTGRWREGDQIIMLGNANFWFAYSDLEPDWRVYTGNSITYKKRNIFSNTPEIDNLGDLDQALRGHRTWVVTSYSIQWLPRIAHIDPAIGEYIDNYSGQKVYMSKDQTAKVYLIDRRSKKRD